MNASYKFWSVGRENPLFLVMVELVRFRRKRLQWTFYLIEKTRKALW